MGDPGTGDLSPATRCLVSSVPGDSISHSTTWETDTDDLLILIWQRENSHDLVRKVIFTSLGGTYLCHRYGETSRSATTTESGIKR
jgi:hypothetical protein